MAHEAIFFEFEILNVRFGISVSFLLFQFYFDTKMSQYLALQLLIHCYSTWPPFRATHMTRLRLAFSVTSSSVSQISTLVKS